MSGPKCGHYSVVSAEELGRRRLYAAKDRFERASAAVISYSLELNSVIQTYGPLDMSPLVRDVPSGDDAAEWESAASKLLEDLVAKRSALAETVATARVRRFTEAARNVTATLTEEAPRHRPVVEPTIVEATVLRVLHRMPLTAAPELIARSEELAEEALRLTGPQAQDRVLSALRFVVQRAQDRARLIEHNSGQIEMLHERLDGLEGTEVERVRGSLRALQLDRSLPDDVETRVTRVVESALAGQDQRYVLTEAQAALADLGYDVEPDFVTMVPHDGALLDLPHTSRHGVMIRARDHQLLVNVVRYDESGQRDPVADTAAEERFCEDFSRLRAALSSRGVDLEMLRSDAPGTTPIQVVRSAPSRVRRQHQKARPHAARTREQPT